MLTEHEKKINSLIPRAVATADRRIQKLNERLIDEDKYIEWDWNKYFHNAMDRLTRERGLRV